MKARLAALCAPLVIAAAVTLPSVYVVRASQPTVTGYRFPAPPVASAGSLGPGQSVSFKLTVVSGTTPDPGGDVYLYQQHTNATGDVTSVPGAQCGGVTQMSSSSASPTHCVADSGGHVALTYTVSQQPPAVGGARWVAENALTRPTVTANTHYAYCTIYRFTPSPIASSGSLALGASVPVTVTAKEGLDRPVGGSPMYLSLRATSGGGSARVGSTTLTSTPKLFTADSGGAIQMTYTAPLIPPTSGVDTIAVQDNASVPTEVNSDMYAFSAATPVVSAGDVTMTEGDQSPGVPAKFTITVSPVQSTAVSVQYTTLCGVGDQGCEGIIPDDFNAVLTPVTVTIPAHASSTTINVEQFSYTGGHGGESYNEGWFVKLLNPSGAVLGRSVGEGLLQPDVESIPAVLPYLYTGGAAVVPNTDPSGEPLYFSVTLGAVESSTVTFNYATASGSALAGVDFTSASGTASIPAGKTSVVIVVTVLPNSPPATNKAFTLTISNASGGSGVLISRPTGTGTILAS
jgi:hypothetical protein